MFGVCLCVCASSSTPAAVASRHAMCTWTTALVLRWRGKDQGCVFGVGGAVGSGCGGCDWAAPTYALAGSRGFVHAAAHNGTHMHTHAHASHPQTVVHKQRQHGRWHAGARARETRGRVRRALEVAKWGVCVWEGEGGCVDRRAGRTRGVGRRAPVDGAVVGSHETQHVVEGAVGGGGCVGAPTTHTTKRKRRCWCGFLETGPHTRTRARPDAHGTQSNKHTKLKAVCGMAGRGARG